MPAHRKAKRKRNITGLRNQPKAVPDPEPSPQPPLVEGTRTEANPELAGGDSEDGPRKGCRDGLEEPRDTEDEPEAATFVGMDTGLETLGSNEPHTMPTNPTVEIHDDPRDEDWTPQNRQRRKKTKQARPTVYTKGPDVGSKSLRTQRRYRALLSGQTSLQQFGVGVVRQDVLSL